MKALKFLIAIVLLFAVLSVGYFKCIEKQKEKIKVLEDKIALLKEEHTPIRFKITNKTGEFMEVSVKFYNADNKEIRQKDFKIQGEELSFDFYVVPVKDRYLAFPSKLFSNTIAPAKGTILYDFYDRDGFPEVFKSKEMDSQLKEGLKKIFQHIKLDQVDSLDNYFGNMVHDIKSFKTFMPETVYSIVTHTKGGIEIVEE